MDNKRVGKKFSTIFWWTLTILPFIYLVVYLIIGIVNIGFTNGSAHLSYSEISEYCSNLFTYSFMRIYTSFTFLSANTPLYKVFEAFKSFYISFGLTSTAANQFAFFFVWMVLVQFFHLLFDVVAWLPRFCHDLIERKC